MHGLRADQYLVRRIGRISRQRAQSIIRAQDFLLEGQAIKPSMRVKDGQRAKLLRYAPDKPSDINNFLPEIIFEDDELLVVNKPSGLSIHPTANCLYKTLTYWLKTYKDIKINPCHRIDKETSGLVICAKNKKIEILLKKAFMQQKVKKTYVAVVAGLIKKSMVINIPLGLQKDQGLVAIRMIKVNNGKPSVTRIRPIYQDILEERTMLICRPQTGRQHQIRAHLSLIGHPIVSDKLYGQGDVFFDEMCRGNDEILKTLPLPRHALHAARLKFFVNNKKYSFSCPIPADILSLIGKI
jgi:23S rRNA pseudouridine1911/1915/1917 synthase